MQTPIRQQQPNFRILYLAPPNATPCTVPPAAHAPFVPLTAAIVHHHLGRHKHKQANILHYAISCCSLSQFVQFAICYLVVTGHCSDCCESVSHIFTAVTCDHEIITDNKQYKNGCMQVLEHFIVTQLLCNIL